MILLVNAIWFWLYFIYFFIAVLLAFFIPGQILVSKLKVSFFCQIVLSFMVGLVCWAWQGFIFGYLGIRFLSYLYLLVCLIFWLKKIFPQFKKNLSGIKFQPDYWLVLLIVLGVFGQLSAVWFNGLYTAKGLEFFNGNFADNFWHISLTSELVRNFPPAEPGMAGVRLINYHYWSNMLVADLIRVFQLPLLPTIFNYFSFFAALFLGLVLVIFSRVNNLGKTFTRWLVFFIYFGADSLFWFFGLFGKGWGFWGMNSLEDGSKFLVNPPRAYSIIIFFAGLALLSVWQKSRQKLALFLSCVVFGSLVGFKVYTGIFALIGLGFLSLYFLWQKKFSLLVYPLLALFLSAIAYLPIGAGSGGLYYTGFWRLENFIVQPALGLDRLELARVIFSQHHNILRVLSYEFLFLVIYTLLLFGSKILGLCQTPKSLKTLPSVINLFLLPTLLINFGVGIFFQQSSGQANTFNFLVSVFIIGSIYTALAVSFWLGKLPKYLLVLTTLLIVVWTVPRIGFEVYENTRRVSQAENLVIPLSLVDAGLYLAKNTDKQSIVVVDLDFFSVDKQMPFLSFLIQRPMFLSGDWIVESHGVDIGKRAHVVKEVFRNGSPTVVGDFLNQNKIEYLFYSPAMPVSSGESVRFIDTIYKNNEVIIGQFNPAKYKEFLLWLEEEEKKKQREG